MVHTNSLSKIYNSRKSKLQKIHAKRQRLIITPLPIPEKKTILHSLLSILVIANYLSHKAIVSLLPKRKNPL